jgi:hypothetical protein
MEPAGTPPGTTSPPSFLYRLTPAAMRSARTHMLGCPCFLTGCACKHEMQIGFRVVSVQGASQTV